MLVYIMLNHWRSCILETQFHKICNLLPSGIKLTSLTSIPFLSHIIVRIFELHNLMQLFPWVYVKSDFCWLEYVIIISQKSQTFPHTIPLYGPLYELYGIIQYSGLASHTLLHFINSFWISWQPFIFIVQCITFKFSYITIKDYEFNVFSWRSTRDVSWMFSILRAVFLKLRSSSYFGAFVDQLFMKSKASSTK